MTKPLDGMLVLSIDQAVAAPYCASRLADAGARVIKIERAEGDFARGYDHEIKGESAFFMWLNRGKESLVADLKNPDDLALLHRIMGKADVFLQNLAPGATDRLGLGSDDLRKRYPRLTTVDISGYGDEGSYAKMKAYDFLVQAESGLISVTGSKEEMGRVGVSICDIACGMFARTAVLEALLLRARTGDLADGRVGAKPWALEMQEGGGQPRSCCFVGVVIVARGSRDRGFRQRTPDTSTATGYKSTPKVETTSHRLGQFPKGSNNIPKARQTPQRFKQHPRG